MSENPLQALFQTFEKISNSVQTHLSNLIGQPHYPSPTTINPLLSLSSPSKSKVNRSNTDSAASLQPKHILDKGKSGSPVTKEDLGRATWTFLHTLAAQYPDNPTRQQKKDVKELVFRNARLAKYDYGSNGRKYLDRTVLCVKLNFVVYKPGKHGSLTKEEDGSSDCLHTNRYHSDHGGPLLSLMAILSRMYPCKECADHFKEVLRANPVQAGSHAEFSQWLCHVHNVVNRSLGKLVFPCERVDARWGKLECEQRACDLLGSTTEFGEEKH
uniref:Sulfhydryl oxidase n=1 Tax=Quercus lobata TaxID=97700 RepID=A0A7N2MXV1_QUELO